jgi:predicted DNA-binding transcriptional regulator AlpA
MDDALPHLLTEAEAAEALGLKPSTLRNWRSQNRGPIGIKVGSNVRYPETSITEWLRQQPTVGGTF